MPLYVSSNKGKDAKVVNILFTRNEEGKGHYSFIRNISCTCTVSQRVTRRNKCALIVMASTSTVKRH